jgi:quercetin dioxygenase-like cupin family protein
MMMEHVLAGDTGQEASVLRQSPQIPLRRIFESEDIGLFHLALMPGQRVPIGHDDLITLVLCLAGDVVLVRNGEVLRIAAGSYAIIPEGETGALDASDEPARLLLFVGLDQLPGAFFNSYGAADV